MCKRPNTGTTLGCHPRHSVSVSNGQSMINTNASPTEMPLTCCNWNNAVHKMSKPKKKITYLISLNKSFTLSTRLKRINSRLVGWQISLTPNLLHNFQVKPNDLFQYFHMSTRSNFPILLVLVPLQNGKNAGKYGKFRRSKYEWVQTAYNCSSNCRKWTHKSLKAARMKKQTEYVNASIVLLAPIEYAATTHTK